MIYAASVGEVNANLNMVGTLARRFGAPLILMIKETLHDIEQEIS